MCIMIWISDRSSFLACSNQAQPHLDMPSQGVASDASEGGYTCAAGQRQYTTRPIVFMSHIVNRALIVYENLVLFVRVLLTRCQL